MDAVFQAFLGYWRAYLVAVNQGDPSGLGKFAAGDEMKAVQAGVAKVHGFGWHSIVDVVKQPSPTINMVSRSTALVTDVTTTHDQLVDGKGKVLTDGQHTTPVIREFDVQSAGAWKVTRVWMISQAPSSPQHPSDPVQTPAGTSK